MNAGGAPVVFAISAIPGAGKTSLAGRLRKRFPTSVFLNHDDYATATNWPLEDVTAWFERGGDCNEFDCSALVEKLHRALKKDMPEPTALFLETHFGRQHRAISPLIDKVIWIDVPLDLALARLIRAFTHGALRQAGGHAEYLTWQQTYLDHYQSILQRMYRRQQVDIPPGADFVVDGRAAADDVAAEVAAFVIRTLRG